MTDVEVRIDSHIIITQNALSRISEVQQYLYDLPQNDDRTTEARESFGSALLQLIATGQRFDGPITIYTDIAPMSFYWSHEKSDYHGGLIFHPSYSDGEPNGYGTWSVHT